MLARGPLGARCSLLCIWGDILDRLLEDEEDEDEDDAKEEEEEEEEEKTRK